MIGHVAMQAPGHRAGASMSRPATRASQHVWTDTWPRHIGSQAPSQVCHRPHSTTSEHAQRAPRQAGLKTFAGSCIPIGWLRGPQISHACTQCVLTYMGPLNLPRLHELSQDRLGNSGFAAIRRSFFWMDEGTGSGCSIAPRAQTHSLVKCPAACVPRQGGPKFCTLARIPLSRIG